MDILLREGDLDFSLTEGIINPVVQVAFHLDEVLHRIYKSTHCKIQGAIPKPHKKDIGLRLIKDIGMVF